MLASRTRMIVFGSVWFVDGFEPILLLLVECLCCMGSRLCNPKAPLPLQSKEANLLEGEVCLPFWQE